MAKQYFTFNGYNSKDYGIYISGSGIYDSPQPDMEYISIPGRNGDLIYDNGRFKNVRITYPCFILKDFRNKFKNFQNDLLAECKSTGYVELMDSYDTKHKRLASIDSTISPDDIAWSANAGSFELTFNCKPQRFLRFSSGDAYASQTATGAFENSTRWPSKPLIRIKSNTFDTQYTDGYVEIDGEKIIEIKKGAPGSITVDSELMITTDSSGANASQWITLKDDTYPTISPLSVHVLSCGGWVRSVDLKGRMYDL